MQLALAFMCLLVAVSAQIIDLSSSASSAPPQNWTSSPVNETFWPFGAFGPSLSLLTHSGEMRSRDLDDGDIYLVKNLAAMKTKKVQDLLKLKTNSILFKQENQVLSYDSKDWYLYKLSGPVSRPEVGRILPVSPCLDSSHGSGGSIVNEYEYELDLSTSVGTSAKYKPVNFAVGFGAGVAVTTSFIFTTSVSCSVAAGSYGQLFITPQVITVPRSERVRVRPTRWGGFAPTLDPEEIPLYRAFVMPMLNHHCIVSSSPDDLQCNTRHVLDPMEL